MATDASNRTLRTLRVLAATTTPLTILELAEAVGVPKRAADRYITTLSRAGVPIRRSAEWPPRYHIDMVDLVRWIGEARRPR